MRGGEVLLAPLSCPVWGGSDEIRKTALSLTAVVLFLLCCQGKDVRGSGTEGAVLSCRLHVRSQIL